MLKKIINILKRILKKKYELNEVFGMQEKPPEKCPTFLNRSVHTQFRHALMSNNIIVVFGESKQGKTWMIERYCPHQLRIGCTAEMNLIDIKKAMLFKLGQQILQVEETVTRKSSDEGKKGLTSSGKLRLPFMEANASSSAEHEKTYSQKDVFRMVYNTIDISNTQQVIQAIKEKAGNDYFVFDNFHYLSSPVQHEFCSLLKDFNYYGIKIIIVGVWKDASRITSLAPDLLNRCEHVDIGSWGKTELIQVAEMGSDALSIKIDKDIINRFIDCSVKNIGIFKNILLKFCQNCGVYETQKELISLSNMKFALQALNDCYQEFYSSISDRVVNLSNPRHHKKESKQMRRKIVCSILRIVLRSNMDAVSKGIEEQDIQLEVKNICSEKGEKFLPPSNITQELGLLHTREENLNSGENFIPLFYFDTPNKKILILEPGLYMIKAYKPSGLESLIKLISTDN